MQWKKAHFIGIAGKGMSATALLLREAGWRISGSDEGCYPPVSEYLAAAGVPFNVGYKADNIPADAELIVVGKNAKLVPDSNAEVAAALASGKPVKSFPEVIGELAAHTDNIVVAGSYGKSTTTALVAWCLKESGQDPSWFVGEITRGFEAHAHLGKGPTFVLEGDEYPSANWDMRSKFLHYHARSLLLTSATHDHVNVYPTHEDYLRPFRELIAQLPHDGLIVVGPEPFARALAEAFVGHVERYGLGETAGWHAANIVYGMPATFDLMHGAQKIISLSTTQLGAHNVENIVGVAALLLTRKLISPEQLAAAVATFEGVKRRMELLSPNSRVPVYEGFGSSFEKARAAIEATKLHYPSRKLVVVFEPHTFTWRNRATLPQYDTVFAGADEVLIYEPATQGAGTHAQLSQDEIVARVQAAGFSAMPIHTADEGVAHLSKTLTKDDVVLLLTSGDLGGLIQEIPALVEREFPRT